MEKRTNAGVRFWGLRGICLVVCMLLFWISWTGVDRYYANSIDRSLTIIVVYLLALFAAFSIGLGHMIILPVLRPVSVFEPEVGRFRSMGRNYTRIRYYGLWSVRRVYFGVLPGFRHRERVYRSVLYRNGHYYRPFSYAGLMFFPIVFILTLVEQNQARNAVMIFMGITSIVGLADILANRIERLLPGNRENEAEDVWVEALY